VRGEFLENHLKHAGDHQQPNQKDNQNNPQQYFQHAFLSLDAFYSPQSVATVQKYAFSLY
jgi:hypothetical protein